MPRAILLAAMMTALATVSCGFIGSDMFPRELQYAAGSYDLAEDLGVEPAEVGELRVERLTNSDGVSRVAVYVGGSAANSLYILDDDLSLLRSYSQDSFSRFLGIDQSGDFACGTVFVPYDTSVDPTVGVNLGCDEGSFDVVGTSSVLYSSDGASGTVLNARNKISSTAYAVDSLVSSGYYFNTLDSSLIGETDRLFALLRDRSSGSSMLAIGFPDIYVDHATMLTTVLNGAQIDTMTGVSYTWIYVDNTDSGWITADGVVALVHGNGSRLIRFDLTSGEELDSIRIDSEWMQGISFEDGGAYWYFYDRQSGRLNKLRTWWR